MSSAFDTEEVLALQDQQARMEALDAERSFLVKAPAGSGKTELLTGRFLVLLGRVEKPEQVLAITFTRAATAEMRDRILKALQGEAMRRRQGDAAADTHARAALEHAEQLGWNLLEQPQRLNIQTIDSLCLRIAHDVPLLSRSGGLLTPTEDAQPLYALAARRTLERLDQSDSAIATALRALLRLRDVNLADCEDLVAQMLCQRHQWLEAFSSTLADGATDWPALRKQLEEPFQRERERLTSLTKDLLSRDPSHGKTILELVRYACGHDAHHPAQLVMQFQSIDELSHPDHYACLRHFLLTKEGGWRKRLTKKEGFPTEKEGGSDRRKDDYFALAEYLSKIEGLQEVLCANDGLPAEGFTNEEWQTVRSILTVLLYAAGELRVVFAEKGSIDFVEAGITADYAMNDPEARRRWNEEIHHLLVDEFQDTSRRQYELSCNLVQDWEPGEGRTCFLVGDPMQSIYLFRQADLALFNEVEQRGFRNGSTAVTFTPLTLSRNFRSDAGIVHPLNEMFTAITGRRHPGEASYFAPAAANEGTPQRNAVHVFAQFENDPEVARENEATHVVEVVRHHLPAVESARASKDEFRVGILVRSRKHVVAIAAALRDAGIEYLALEIEALQDRQEIRDLCSLVRALLSPLDRVAWLSILRAPWCGLSLADLHLLCGQDDAAMLKRPIIELLTTRSSLLSEDGAQRAQRLLQTMQLAHNRRFTGPFSASPSGFAAWVERTWKTLGGVHCVDDEAHNNVQAFFMRLCSMTPDGMEASGDAMQESLRRLFAAPSNEATVRCGVQIMTIHKAKGLGFDVVIVPALERISRRQGKPLIHWLERTRRNSSEKELLIAPIDPKGRDTSATYKWVGQQRCDQETEELQRLLYVSCTRAKHELHLLGTVGVNEGKEPNNVGAAIKDPTPQSLLGVGWPYLAPLFAGQFTSPPAVVPGPVLVAPAAKPGSILRLAAQVAGNGQVLRRLPADWSWPTFSASGEEPSAVIRNAMPASGPDRTAKANGTVIHALFQHFASLPVEDPLRDLAVHQEHWTRVARAMLLNAGVGAGEDPARIAEVLRLLKNAVNDAEGGWIVGQRRQAKSESAWSYRADGKTSTVRADRIFIAGAEPQSSGESHLWIVDYKTTDFGAKGSDIAQSLKHERSRHEAQLTGYARILKQALPCDLPLRFALYYPSMPRLDWWAE